MAEPADDLVVEAVLADLARIDADMAAAARAGFDSLTWGEGLRAVTGHALADFLWYQLPTKWLCDLDEKQQVAAALGELFHRLGRTRYADMCGSAATADILAVYEHDGGTAGFKAYRSALAASGLQPPDLPGVLEWGSVMGSDEAGAYASASLSLEHVIDSGELRPGRPGWRKTADQTTRVFLDSPRDDLTGSTWLQWVHTERLQNWADGHGTEHRRLATAITNQLLHPVAVPDTAADHLAPLQWLLDHAATGAALTQTGTLTRPLVAEGCRRFDWLTLTANPRSESDIVELWTLRELAKQMGVVRRSGRKLLLSSIGKTVHAEGTPALWQATMTNLLGPDAADAAAGEVALLLMLSGQDHDYRALDTAVAHALAEQGWRDQHTGQPVTPDQTGRLLGDLRRQLRLLDLTTSPRFDEPLRLTDAGRLAAHAALRARALRPRAYPHL
ncbi:hypothetical protein [Paractinoplanes hotanensis]|uniref:Helicase XPB/Ssl2 N-terminal domain-containing protein n=1 Tax=Paractinoplanes hotanensis TaxID=2906497 RepID=A0ABT0YHH5_9ACTN|nr:hypothetical protein [Actinoplanes hotanensis]MCM4084947.1 hypothetical protein [Actinoplanes hotanensis]